jgi:F-type H+-transporting ATPase subunit delta
VRGLAERAGLAELKEGLAAIEQVARGQRGTEAEVWSAVELLPAERQTLEAALHRRYGDAIPIRYHVEPSILGGVIVRVGDRYVDGSLATKLGQLRQQLLTGRA